MINKDRIVPVTKTDLLTLYGAVMAIANVSYGVVQADDVEGNFSITGSGAAGNKLLAQPAKSIDFVSGVTSATAYFVAADDFEGFKKAGVAAVPASGEVSVKGGTLYKAALASGNITVTAVSPIQA